MTLRIAAALFALITPLLGHGALAAGAVQCKHEIDTRGGTESLRFSVTAAPDAGFTGRYSYRYTLDGEGSMTVINQGQFTLGAGETVTLLSIQSRVNTEETGAGIAITVELEDSAGNLFCTEKK
ncbi:hypothetical protein [Pseudogemmobacter bohemicus]|uniref:hypothetical protein n=1 Tax=Pseudogemmobacter bohemicus TaxID=2250708 RepID=UPI000DD327FA|nr:hypothetical protein [Pseudogemmobacter bohemicus]